MGTRLEKFKRLPNIRRGFASGLCSAGATGFLMGLYGILRASGYQLGIPWLIGLLLAAEGIATIIFFSWAQAAIRLKEGDEQNAN